MAGYRPWRMYLVGLAFAVTFPSGAADYYVDATGGQDAPARGTQAQPWKTINYALDHISGSAATPHRVNVAAGIYVENVVCDDYESLYGGYNASTWARDLAAYATTISGNNTDSAVVLGQQSTLDGFTISNGRRDYGGGLYCNAITASVSNCLIRQNEATVNGSAVYVHNGTLNVRFCQISHNTKNAVYVDGGSASLESNIISDTYSGSGILAENSSSLIMNSDRVLRNAQRGIESRSSTLNASHCIIGQNNWMGAYIHNGAATFDRCLVFRNNFNVGMSGDFNGAGIGCGGDVTIRRSVFCQNTSSYRGGALYYGCNVFDSVFVANRSGWGHGCFFVGGPTTLKNNFFVNNGRIDFNELTNGGVPLTSVNNSLIQNDAGYFCNSWLVDGDIRMTNDLLWGNGDDLSIGERDTGKNIQYCNIEDGDFNGVRNNISVIPDFVGRVTSGTIASIQFDAQNCRSTITDASANLTSDALARTFLWTNNTAFYVESNTVNRIVVYGDVTLAASAGYDYSVQDYRLAQGSLCIDAGTGVGALDHDFEGDPRPINGGQGLLCDIGADEYSDQPPPNDPPAQPTIVATIAIMMAVPSSDPEGKPVRYTVRWESSTGDTIVHANCTSVQGTMCDVMTECDRLRPGQTWTITCTPNDGQKDGPAATVTIRICGSATDATLWFHYE